MKTLDLNFFVGRMEGSQLRVVSKIFLSFRNQGKDGHPEGGGVHPHIKIRDFEAKHPKLKQNHCLTLNGSLLWGVGGKVLWDHM